MYRPPISRVAFAMLVTAASGSILAADVTASYPVGGVCAGSACQPAQDFAVTTDGALSAAVAVAFACESLTVQFSVDGALKSTSSPVLPGGTTGSVDLGPVTAGAHTLTVTGQQGGFLCDSLSWSGTLSVTTSGVTDDDVAFANPGDTVTVSTAVAGSPRPAGITATLFHGATATATARISVTTYAGIPSVLAPSPPPIRAAAYLDLQLSNADDGDVIVGELLPPNPILPPNPVLPPNPIVPPNPIRLTYWDGAEWAPVFGAQLIPGSPPILPAYNSIDNLFTVTLGATSTPAITALSGTVFAAIPNYYFRGFGVPLDPGMLNVAKAGRAIPLKWQVFDYVVEPVLDLDSAVVKISSVAISCANSGESTDDVEEYAVGASGLQNLGDGTYQLNWGTSKSYAGTCRRLRLDLGERNPDGTVFYRTADFKFTR